ncbi:MAG: hypothetical protein RL456_684 [Pseudomonadota bacterium]|jgi:cytochrome c553
MAAQARRWGWMLAMLAAGAMAQTAAVPPRPLAMANGIRFEGPSVAPAGSVRSLWVMHCAGCHAMDGSGHPDQGVPDMRGTLGRFLHHPQGRGYLVQVPGVNNAGLTDAQIADLTNWLIPAVSAGTAPAGWAPYRAEEVARWRRERPADIAAARRALLARLPPDPAGGAR